MWTREGSREDKPRSQATEEAPVPSTFVENPRTDICIPMFYLWPAWSGPVGVSPYRMLPLGDSGRGAPLGWSFYHLFGFRWAGNLGFGRHRLWVDFGSGGEGILGVGDDVYEVYSQGCRKYHTMTVCLDLLGQKFNCWVGIVCQLDCPVLIGWDCPLLLHLF